MLGGGIGAGKSTIGEVFAQHGFSVIEADVISAEIMGPGSEATLAVARRWPEVVEDGVVDRGALARVVFADASELQHLEAITHPAIAAEVDRRCSEDPGAVLVEVPLPHLELSGDWLRIAAVADVEIRIARAIARGGDADDTRRRVSSQMSDSEWAEWADVVIDNSGAWAATLEAAEAVIEACA
jgi:dephospho-CoA kinase